MTLELQAVSVSYDGGATLAVDGVSFAAGRGELVVLVGESGCGKTTTLKSINRLVVPTSGRVVIDGADTAGRDPVSLRRSIGYVFQGVGLFPHLTVAENVAVTPTLLGWPPERIAGRVRELLRLVHLDPDDYAERLPAALSGGQRQRVGVARALAAGPGLMLLDEPFGALDPITRDHVRDEFRSIQHTLELTAVLVTHDMSEALLVGDRVVVMRRGRVVREGTPRELLAAADDPYVAELIGTPRRQAEQLVALGERRTAT